MDTDPRSHPKHKKHHLPQAPLVAVPARAVPAAAARPAVAAATATAEPEAVARRRFQRGSTFKVRLGVWACG
jgi:hypothetical protein